MLTFMRHQRHKLGKVDAAAAICVGDPHHLVHLVLAGHLSDRGHELSELLSVDTATTILVELFESIAKLVELSI